MHKSLPSLRRILILVFPLVFLLAPSHAVYAQTDNAGDQTVSSTTAQQGDDSDKKDKKKKDKDKDEVSEDVDFFSVGIERFNLVFFTRLLIDLLSMLVIVRLIYYPVYKRRDHFFTFFMFNLTIFIITFLLNIKGAGISTGAAFGLFAVFSLL